jgi:predicted signal transduction protein with EAL and GGDEF domain
MPVTMPESPVTIIRNHWSRSAGIRSIAIYPGNGARQDDLLTNADAAMYHAKASGRNAYCFFEASINAHVHEQLQLVQDLRLAPILFTL